MTPSFFEWAGAITGLIGSALLALNLPVSRFGWLMFLASNFFLLCFAYLSNHTGLLMLQVGFTLTSVIGIVRAFKRDNTAVSLSLAESRPSRIFAK